MSRLWLLLAAASLFAQTPRPLQVDDAHAIKSVSDPQVSPDGAWVAYTLTTINKAEDKSDTDIWMVKWDGSQRIQLTSSKESESSPRWSPDGQWLAFSSARADPQQGAQIWLMNRAGGEATQLTTFKGSVGDFVWSPDSKRFAVVMTERDEDPPKPGDKPKTAKPLVIDRYQFKQDGSGYLTRKPSQIWLFDIAAKKAERLTKEEFEEGSPSWSPDGRTIAFYSNRAGLTGRYARWQICRADAQPGSAVKEITTGELIGGRGGRPVWSPDGATLFFLAGRERKYRAYNRMKIAAVPAAGGEPVVRPSSLDRSIGNLQRLSTGNLAFLVTDDMREYPAQAPASGGNWDRMLTADSSVNTWNEAAGHMAVLMSTDDQTPEIYALEGGRTRALTSHNAGWRKGIVLGETREFKARTRDGAEVHSLLTLPPGYKDGTKLPLLLRIHGGPNGQDSHAFQFERHLFAAHGYAVLNVNYRGSAGRDEAFQTAIFADWGGKEVTDLLASVDQVIAMGIADPDRLGIGGWSYGGILTDYTIARDPRFKAATSGAGSALQLSMYGSDQYIEQYDLELGFPWDPAARDNWLRISYPFFEANRIRTPTLFFCGQNDFNVPVIGSEQMYQALKANGVDTQLIIYPGENHGIRKPTYVQDRYERYLAWYAKYLKPDAPLASK